jgi:hypothetical protein
LVAVNLVVASAQADAVGWICLFVGIGILGAGVFVGLWTSLRKTPQKATTRLEEAKARLGQAQADIERTRIAVADPNSEAAASATDAAEAAQESTAAADTALEQVEGIVSALPENLRFAGLLVLVGTVLIGVATIQFGGVSLF